MTRKGIEDRVIATVGLQDIDPLNELTLVREWVYMGTLDLLSRTRCVARCIHLSLTPEVATYTLDHSVLALIGVDYGDDRRLRRDDADGRGFVLIRSDILQFQPTPVEAQEVDVWAVLRPQPMPSDTSHLGEEAYGAIPDEFQDAVELYALWKASDYTHEQSSTRGERYRVLYEGQDGRGGRIRQIKELVNKRGSSFAPRRKSTVRRVLTPRSAWVD